MRSGITRRWLRGNLLITVLLVLLAETMFLYNYTRSYYNSVQQTMYRRFSSVSGQLKMYTGDTVQSTAATRSVALRRSGREAAESKLRNGVIDTNDLLRKITDEATAATARSAREIELLKTIYELKHTINR